SKSATGHPGVLWMGLLVVGGAIVGLIWLLLVYPHRARPGSERTVQLVIEENASLAELSSELREREVIDSVFVFLAYARLQGAESRLRTGSVMLSDAMSPADVLSQIARGYGPSRVRVTLPEGLHRFSIAERLAQAGVCEEDAFLSAAVDRELLDALEIPGQSAEGYLFPDTYEFDRDADPEHVVRTLVSTFHRRVEPLYDEHPAGERALGETLGFRRPEILTLASIVEKEAGVAEERPVIAGVFLNRLRFETFRPKRLQADPTVSYGCLHAPDVSEPCRNYEGRISRNMLQDRQNPYNTYRHEGLPPGPIANPGLASLRAVLVPAEHAYLYFVARGGGRHVFSENLDDHNRAVNRFIRGQE
ncbi:MAG: endolytic transglycosylase MltG, partial [Myxococcota bacterium]